MYSFVGVLYRAFDVEMLYIAQTLGIPIAEVAVNWQEIEGMVYYAVVLKPIFGSSSDQLAILHDIR